MHCTRKITNDLIWVGVNDRQVSLFENLYPVSNGMAYNSYILLDEKTVLFDTVSKDVSHRFMENVSYALGEKKLDYLVVHHMEPDHAAGINEILKAYPDVKIVCNEKTRTFSEQFFDVDENVNYHIVKENDTLCTGRHTLRFIMASMVHWPEVMVTYDETHKTLFSADAFGSFGASNGIVFTDEIDFESEYTSEMRRYYANIVGKYGTQVQALLKKAFNLEIEMICPLHGLLWRSHIDKLFSIYNSWSSYTPESVGVMIVYGSIYGGTENAAEILACKLRERGIKTTLIDASSTHVSHIVSAAFQWSHIVFASITYNAGLFLPIGVLVDELISRNFQNRTIAIIENGTWASACGDLIRTKLEKAKNINILESSVCIKSSVKEENLNQIETMADEIAASVSKYKK